MVAPNWSAWMPWETYWKEGYRSPDMENSGVYLLACFEESPEGAADPTHERIVYVGETTGQYLQNRLYQFNRSAHEGKDGHSGGWTYRDLKEAGRLPAGSLHVAVLSIPRDAHPFLSFFIKHQERAAIWGYVERHGKPPLCNRD